MPRASNGTCTLAEDAFVPNTTIVSADMNSDLSDIVSMLTDSLSVSGKGGMSAALDMNSHQINELTAGAAATDATNLTQVQSLISAATGAATPWVAAGGTANAITATFSPAITLIDGQLAFIRALLANTTTTPTFAPNGLTARTIVKNGGTALSVGDIQPLTEMILRYNLANTRWEFLNPDVSLTALGAIAGAAVSKTAAYSIVNADKGKTFYFAGSAYYTITVGAASGFDSDFQCRVVNTDARGKLMAVNGITNFILWPLQTVTLVNTGSAWTLDPRNVRWIPNSAVTFYVNSGGSDSNDGLATGTSNAFATIQHAVDVVHQVVDTGNSFPTIQLDNGTHSVAAGVGIYYPLVGSTQMLISGSTAAINNVIVTCSAGGNCFIVRDGSVVSVSGLTISTAGSGSTALAASQGAVLDTVGKCWLTAFASGAHFSASTWASINIGADYDLTSNVSSHLTATFGAYINYGSFTVNLPAITFTIWATAANGGYISAGGVPMTFTGAGAGAGSTGQKYNSSNNAVITSSTTVFPGATAGAVSTGGLYS